MFDSKQILARLAAKYRAEGNISTAELLEKHSRRPGPRKKATEQAKPEPVDETLDFSWMPE